MGGTSADICLIQEGRPAVTYEGEIGPFPLQIPMTDIHTIGVRQYRCCDVPGQFDGRAAERRGHARAGLL